MYTGSLWIDSNNLFCRFWCLSSLDNYVISGRTCIMQFIFLIHRLSVVLRHVLYPFSWLFFSFIWIMLLKIVIYYWNCTGYRHDYVIVWKPLPHEIWGNSLFYQVHQDNWKTRWWAPFRCCRGWQPSQGRYIQFGIFFLNISACALFIRCVFRLIISLVIHYALIYY